MADNNTKSKINTEENIIRKIKELCRAPDLKPEDWHKYGPKVILFKLYCIT